MSDNPTRGDRPLRQSDSTLSSDRLRVQLERVELRGQYDAPTVAVLFLWEGEDELFGLSYDISKPTDWSVAAADRYISVYVRESLCAVGMGVENAIRETDGDATWLRWQQWM
jgi:hypothetical protein